MSLSRFVAWVCICLFLASPLLASALLPAPPVHRLIRRRLLSASPKQSSLVLQWVQIQFSETLMGTDVTSQHTHSHRYEQLADQLARQIRAGRFRPGDRIPGTRLLSETHGVSINTVLQAQKLLESQGLIEAIPRSGFFVRWRSEEADRLPDTPPKTPLKPILVQRQRLALDLIQATSNTNLVQLGAALPHESYFPGRALKRIAARITRSEEHTSELQSREKLVCRLLLEKKNT